MDYNFLSPETPEGEEKDINCTSNDLSSPNPVQVINENENKNKKEKDNPKKKVFDIDYGGNYYIFSLTNLIEKYLCIELIPIEGSLPFPYRAIYSLQILNMIEYLFKDLKTVDECIEKISSLFSKNRLNIYRDEAKDLFYIILKITIIDEDKYIPLKLNCVKQLQVCTIRYIYREITGLRKKYDEYKNNKTEIIKAQSKELKNLKILNQKMIKIIQTIKDMSDKTVKNKYDQLSYKILNLKKDLIYQKMKFKLEIIPNQKILIFPVKNAQKGFNIDFKIKNIGYSFLSTKYDKIFFDRNTKLSSNEIDFVDKNDTEIKFDNLFKPKEIMSFNPKFIIKNAKEDQIYNFYINIYSTIHGIISVKPLIIQALIYPENLKGEELSKYLENNFEINLKWNNIYIYDVEGKKILLKNKKNVIYPISDDEDDEHFNRYIGKKNKIKRNKPKENYLSKIKMEIKEYLNKNKDVKITENKMMKIIERLNLEYFASLWLEHKKMFDIIVENKGHYHQISQIVEELL